MELSELSYALRAKRDQWWNAVIAGEWAWAAFYANDLEVITRNLVKQTHKLLEEHHADPKAALGRHHRSPKSPASGDGR